MSPRALAGAPVVALDPQRRAFDHALRIAEAARGRGTKRGPRSFHGFCRRRSVPAWQEGPHHKLLCGLCEEAVTQAAADQGTNLMIFAAPQHGKSHVVSVLLPVWTLGTFPYFRILLASYGAQLAEDKSREARDLLELVGPDEFGVEVSRKSSATARWSIASDRGRMRACGVGGALTGSGGDLLICDDPIKNEKEAASRLVRDAVWGWWRTVFSTRAKHGASTILIMTRWHEDDLAGRLLQEQGEVGQGGKWRVVNLRAVIDTEAQAASDPLHRRLHQVLWPKRYPPETIADRKVTLGPYFFSALFQGEPQPEGGTMFKRSTFQYFHETDTPRGPSYVLHHLVGNQVQDITVLAEDCWHFVTVDPALTKDQRNDWFVAEEWIVTPPIAGGPRLRLLSDVLRVHLEVPDQLPRLIGYAKDSRATFVGVEESTGSLAVIQQAERDQKIVVRRCKPDRDKQARAAPLSGRYEAMQVYHRAAATWLDEYERELLDFPNGVHDDQVDTGAFAELILLAGDGTVVDALPVSLEQVAEFRMGEPPRFSTEDAVISPESLMLEEGRWVE